jgi:class 3 adenylate cyclase
MTDLPRKTCTDGAVSVCPVRRYVPQVTGSRGYSRERPATSADLPWLPCIPLHRAVVAVDIVGSTTRANPAKARLRQLMYKLLNQALRTSGIPERHHDPLIDRGDGALVLIQPSDQIPKTLLLHTFFPALHQLLANHNAHHAEHAFQLRVAVHAGEVHYDQWGQFGEALDITCRLLDAPEFKRILASTTAPVALVVSDDFYRSIVKHGYDEIDARKYRQIVRVEMAGVAYPGWVQVLSVNLTTTRWPRHRRIVG